MNKIISIIIISTLIFASCGNNNNKADAYGNFEAVETIISSQTAGTVLKCNINEGDVIQAGDTAYVIDTIAILLQKQQVMSKKTAVSSKFSSIIAQVDVLNQQKKVLLKEQNRIANLLKDSAATQKQSDDINGKLNILNTQIQQVKTEYYPLP